MPVGTFGHGSFPTGSLGDAVPLSISRHVLLVMHCVPQASFGSGFGAFSPGLLLGCRTQPGRQGPSPKLLRSVIIFPWQ